MRWRHSAFADLLGAGRSDLVTRWTRKLDDFDDKIAAYDALPAGPSRRRPVRGAARRRGGRSRPSPIRRRPTRGAAAHQLDAQARRLRDAARPVRRVASTSTATRFADFLDPVAALLPVTAFDPQPFDLTPFGDRAVRLAQDLATQPRRPPRRHRRAAHDAVQQQLDGARRARPRRPTQVQALQNAAQALLGDDFRIVPEFALAPAQADEWANAVAAVDRRHAARRISPTTAGIDFPVDEWLTGVARVRPMLHAFETADAAGRRARPAASRRSSRRSSRSRPDAPWLAMQFPPGLQRSTATGCCYTAQYATPFDKTARQCGLLLDEWTEVIPATDAHHRHHVQLRPARQRAAAGDPAGHAGDRRPAPGSGTTSSARSTRRSTSPRSARSSRAQLDATPYAALLPATVMAVTLYGISITHQPRRRERRVPQPGGDRMPSALRVADIRQALARAAVSRRSPPGTGSRRGRARTSFDRALRAEVRDALWMLTKQWQMGEFRGSDAGSPVFAKLQIDTTRLTKYRPDAHADAAVRRRRAARGQGRAPAGAAHPRRPADRVRPAARHGPAVAEADRRHRRLPPGVHRRLPDHRARPDPQGGRRRSAPTRGVADAGGGRRPGDGRRRCSTCTSRPTPANHAYDGVAGIDPATTGAIDDRAQRFVAWFERAAAAAAAAATTPGCRRGSNTSSPPRRRCRARREKVYVADEYDAGPARLVQPRRRRARRARSIRCPARRRTGLPPDAPQTMIPIPVSFAGMPNTRWWAFEDRKTQLRRHRRQHDRPRQAAVHGVRARLRQRLVRHPVHAAGGAIATIRALRGDQRVRRAVLDRRGRRRRRRRTGSAGACSRSTCAATARPRPTPACCCCRPPRRSRKSPPTEDVMLIRDEVANMVWGVERDDPARRPARAKRGIEAARQTRAFFEAQLAAPPRRPAPPPPCRRPPPRRSATR